MKITPLPLKGSFDSIYFRSSDVLNVSSLVIHKANEDTEMLHNKKHSYGEQPCTCMAVTLRDEIKSSLK